MKNKDKVYIPLPPRIEIFDLKRFLEYDYAFGVRHIRIIAWIKLKIKYKSLLKFPW